MDLWVEKYRPKTLKGFVFSDDGQKQLIEKWIEDCNIPSVGLWGQPGSGKTTLANILIGSLNIHEGDVMRLNGSKENNVDTVREKIYNFITSMSFGGSFRIVFIDEADYLSINSQSILRNLMETYSNTSRFIMTGNYEHRIIPALKSRLQEIRFNRLDSQEYQMRMIDILEKEGIEIDSLEALNILDLFIRVAYPDLRKGINLLQQYSMKGKLTKPSQESKTTDYTLTMVDLFKKGQITEARKLICSQIRTEEYEELYRFFYRNLELWGTTEEKQEQAILEIAKGIRNHTISADPEINLAATLVALKSIHQS